MATVDKTITISGTNAQLSSVLISTRNDGATVLVANGTSSDGSAIPVQLNEARLVVTGVAAVDNLMARALLELRKANGLDT